MSTTIDERVVEMRFDNKQFEQNVQTSISTIEKLEKKLKSQRCLQRIGRCECRSKKLQHDSAFQRS